MSKRRHKPETLLAHLGRDYRAHFGLVNPPVCHGSTILFDDVDTFERTDHNQEKSVISYGRGGTPTTFALEETVAEMEGGYRAFALCSGLAAVSVGILSAVDSGGHALICDNIYGPSRRFCSGLLGRLGVEATYYDPLIGAGIESLFQPNTQVVFLESPGSLTFEMQDVPAIVKAAKAAGVRVVMDNTWATFLHFQPLAHGVDISVQAGTKYMVGHADAMFGVITCTEEIEPRLRQTFKQLGQCAAPDDVYLALRGLRTMAVRLARHQQSATEVAKWLQGRAEVDRVLYPALPEDPGHAIWQRDFTGACGLFGIVLSQPYAREVVNAMINGMELFGIGVSWGGFESLLVPSHPEKARSATTWSAPGPSLRIHVGLEDAGDLIADLEAGFERLTRAAGGQDG